MPLDLIVTGDDCVGGDLSKSYGNHVFNWGSDSEKAGHVVCDKRNRMNRSGFLFLSGEEICKILNRK